MKQYLFTRPGEPEENATDRIYLDLCNRLLEVWEESGFVADAPDDLRHVVVTGLIGYYQDVLCDTGLWRSFTDECLRRYGRRVPFHADTEEYVVYELNSSDVEFVLWYELAFNSMQFRFRYPLDKEIVGLAGLLFAVLESGYDDMVNPEGHREFFDVELNNPEDSEHLYNFIQWLYWKNWLILPPFQLTYSQLYPELIELQNNSADSADAAKKIDKFRHQIMASLPTGPLALYLREWLSLIVDGRPPKERPRRYIGPDSDDIPAAEEHPYYTAFMKANGDRPLRFIADYAQLNDFFIKGMGWNEGEEHLPAMKSHSDFVLMATPHGGLMVAKNIAKCISHPDNHLYDREYARKFAFNLISQRAVCPGDMLRYICSNGWLPDATFPEYPSLYPEDCRRPTEDERRNAACDNWDFLSRVYLQEYYRGD